MAKFEEAFLLSMKHEGAYANDPDDPGLETYKGVSRKHHPEWSGWSHVDEVIKNLEVSRPGLRTQNRRAFALLVNRALEPNAALQEAIKVFYLGEFWNPLNLFFINNQRLANKVFDFGVNAGKARAVRFFQEALCMVGLPVKVDGAVGPATIKAANACSTDVVISEFRELCANYYRGLAQEHPTLAKFLGEPPSEADADGRGWLGRAYA